MAVCEIGKTSRAVSTQYCFCGDFNEHQSFGSLHTNVPHGKSLYETTDLLDLIVINDGNPTRNISPNQSLSAVDIKVSIPNFQNINEYS